MPAFTRRPTFLLALLILTGCLYIYLALPAEPSRPFTYDPPPKDGSSDASSNDIPPTPLTFETDPFRPGTPRPPGSNYSRILVIPRTSEEDVSWITSELPDVQTAIYVMDDPSAPFHPPENKGRESTAYLTYIIDHYDSLPDIVLFFHAHRLGWHNVTLLGQDTPEMIKRLSSERVWRVGYQPARCDHKPGCPDWIHLDRPEVDYDEVIRMEEKYFTPEIWRELHPPGMGLPGEYHRVPPVLSAPCCAQFAVSRERIRANPRSVYEHYRRWLLTTTMDGQLAGRIMEYTWHYVFTRNYQFCPAEHTCYCDAYGICFGSAVKWDEYKSAYERRDEVWKILDRQDIGEDERMEAEQELVRLSRWLDERREEAFRRGESEEARWIEREKVALF